MTQDIFISYSRRDQEFVTRLASDLNSQVAGVWFDQSAIQPGERWHDEIMEGIRECKAFILVLSPDAMGSRYVREEVNKALELGKPIFPVIYRPAQWTGEFERLVHDVQTLDLRSGSYTDSFHKLVDGLIAAGAIKAEGDRPFLRQPVQPSLGIAFRKIPAWALAWSAGWIVFSIVLVVFLAILVAAQGEISGGDFLNFLVIVICFAIGGMTGGSLAGFLTMLTLRPNAPSIAWKHISPTIRVWGVSGSLGVLASGLITIALIALGAFSIQGADPSCTGSVGECLGQVIGSALGELIVWFLVVGLVFLALVVAAWFLTGMFAGWQVVRHIRRLEPGITSGQGWRVSAGWGCGAVTAAAVMIVLIVVVSNLFGL